MNVLRKIWPAYLTAFVIALSMAVGFALGVIVANSMALNGVAQLQEAVKQQVLAANQ